MDVVRRNLTPWLPFALVVFVIAALAIVAIGIATLEIGDEHVVAGYPPNIKNISLQRGIGPARLGMSRNAVSRTIGDPDEDPRVHHSDGGQPITAWIYHGPRLRLEFRRIHGHDALGSISIAAPGARTRAGIGMGSHETSLRRALPDVRCLPGRHGDRYCTLGTSRAGERQTVFQLRGGRVRRVTILIRSGPP